MIDDNHHGRGHGFGLWIEKLPQTTDAEAKTFFKNFNDALFFQSCIAEQTDPDRLLEKLFPDGFRILAVTKPKLTCSCTKERLWEALKSLPVSDLTELFLEGKGIESQCDYCHKVWSVSDDELKDFLQVSSTKH